ncbi:MAG TPA: peptidylprolyl isomerase, partial [candidate division Zixibacteria bacterium]|nr:peptidylprolyl isomerase [candidate division Zixibacteria bacterium]
RLVRKLENENDELLRMDLLSALVRQKNPDGVPRAEELLEDSPSDNTVCSVIKYLATVQGDRVISLIDSLALLHSPAIKAACAEAYGIVGNPTVTSRLGVLFNDPDPSVRAAAFDALTTLDAQNMTFYIDKALTDSNFVLQSLAIDKISTGKLQSYLPKMNDLMTAGEKTEVDVRRSLVEASVPFIEENKEDTAARELLIKGILDPAYVVRLVAANEYKRLLGENRFKQVPPAETKLSVSTIEKGIRDYKTNPSAMITTNKGNIEMELYFDTAPLTVLNFVHLATKGFYNGLIFHRVISNFVVQGGDPLGTGWGGPGYFIRDEYSSLPYKRGTVGIATSGKDTGGSQFFITLSPQPHLVGRYTVFGQVVSGMDVAESILPGDTIRDVIIK